MLTIAGITLVALLGSAVCALAGWGSPLAVAHLAFAVGNCAAHLCRDEPFCPCIDAYRRPKSMDPPFTVHCPDRRRDCRTLDAGLVATQRIASGRCGRPRSGGCFVSLDCRAGEGDTGCTAPRLALVWRRTGLFDAGAVCRGADRVFSGLLASLASLPSASQHDRSGRSGRPGYFAGSAANCSGQA